MRAFAALTPDLDPHRVLAEAAVQVGLANLLPCPFVRAAVEAGNLRLEGCIFDLADGGLRIFDRASGRFRTVATDI